VPGYDEWTNLPNVWFNRDNGTAKLNGNHCDNRYHENALPILWDSSPKKPPIKAAFVLPD